MNPAGSDAMADAQPAEAGAGGGERGATADQLTGAVTAAVGAASRADARLVAEPPDLESSIDDIESVRRRCLAFRDIFAALRAEIGRVIVGQDHVVEQVLWALFADGHVLLEGVPGLGKTLLVRTLGDALALPFNRIQFTPDLMPADITGTTVVVDDPRTGHRSFDFRKGPIFSQIVLADEINRATPKSQAALLEAMGERHVTVAGRTHPLDRPFLVMATQNPIEQEGTYSLPEAQLDRFLLKVTVPFASRTELMSILQRTTAGVGDQARAILDSKRIIQAQRLARRIVVTPFVQDFAIRLVLATHPRPQPRVGTSPPRGPDGAWMPEAVRRNIAVGVSPRGAQALITVAKVRALVDGRFAVAFADIEAVAPAALRHRIIRSFEAESDGVTTDDIVKTLLEAVPRR